MKRILKTVAIMLLCGIMVSPTLEARGRNNGNQRREPTTQPASRPGNGGTKTPSNRPSTPSNRPGNSGTNRPSTPSNRPGNSGNNRPSTPSNRPGNSGNNRPSTPSNRPGNPGNRPGGPGFNGPATGNKPGHKPNPGHGPNHGPVTHGHGPMRPHMYPPRPYSRPLPPPSWRPAPGWRPFHSVLGIAFGTAVNISVNALINSGYTVNYYGNDAVYVSNVPMLNMYWPDAVLYYGNAGLCGSRFIYSTAGYNMTRYNMTYNALSGTYGAPVSIQNTSNGIEATWWGTDNQFIRLSYMSEYAYDGSTRYYTTLSFGN